MIGLVAVVGASTLIGLACGAVAAMFGEPFTVGLALGGGGAATAFVCVRHVYNEAETNRCAYRTAMGRLILDIAIEVERTDEQNGNALASIATAVSADVHGDDESASDILAAIIQARQRQSAETKIRQLEQTIAERDRATEVRP